MVHETRSLEDMIKELPPDLYQEVKSFTERLLATKTIKRGRKKMRFTWVGALSEFRDQYTSLDLQQKTQEWWNDEIPH
jgi:uncharacterized protein DUF2281